MGGGLRRPKILYAEILYVFYGGGRNGGGAIGAGRVGFSWRWPEGSVLIGGGRKGRFEIENRGGGGRNPRREACGEAPGDSSQGWIKSGAKGWAKCGPIFAGALSMHLQIQGEKCPQKS